MKQSFLTLTLFLSVFCPPGRGLQFPTVTGLGMTGLTVAEPTARPPAKAYICKSASAHAYHSSTDCRGLQKCTHEIVSIAQTDAVNAGYRACKMCE